MNPRSPLERPPIALLNFNPLRGRYNPPSSPAMNGLLLIITRPPSTSMYPIRTFKVLMVKKQNF